MPLLSSLGFHVYAIDFPGHGLADKPLGYPYGSPAFSEVVVAALESVAPAGAIVLGTSLGGHVAGIVAVRRPDLVRACVLIGAVGLVVWDRPAGSPIVDTTLAGTEAKLRFLVHDPSLVHSGWVLEESLVNSSPGAEAALAATAHYTSTAIGADLVGERLRASGIATMLVWGAQDRWVPPSVGEAAARALPGASFALVEATGHAPYFEAPSRFVELVRPFLQSVAPGPAGP
jgi:2-hydroxy-6-oxonona-2,4-dienedioate hydrolase